MTMAKPRTKTKTKLQRRAQRPQGYPGGGLDEPARLWAKLLADPCAGTLAPPCYPSGSGGTLVRVESDFIYGSAATLTAGVVCFTPALLAGNTTTVTNTSLAAFTLAADTTATVFNSSDLSALQPGLNQVTSWSGVRPVAACIQVYWPGSELNRQGVVSFANVAAGVLENIPTSVANLRSLSQNVMRVPENMAEIKWRPGEADNQFINPNTPPVGNQELTGHNSVMVTFAGLPTAVGIRFRCVVVYEVIPASGSGFVVMPQTRPGSRYTVNDILGALDRGGNWALTVGHQLATTFDAGARLAKTAGRVLSFGARALPALAW